MAAICINVPAAAINLVLDAVAEAHGWTEASGVTKAQFFQRWMIDVTLAVVVARESSREAETARLAAVTKVETEIGRVMRGTQTPPLLEPGQDGT